MTTVNGLSMPNSEDTIKAVSALLKRPVQHVDGFGYQHEITAGAIHSSMNAVAWVQCDSKSLESGHVDIEYRLKCQVDDRLVIDWIVQTYNPYFGCNVRYMAWYDRWIVMVYREKHHTYVCSHSIAGGSQTAQLTDEWLVANDHIAFRSETPDFVDRLRLPGLKKLPPITARDARSARILPPNYDERNDWNKRYGRRKRNAGEVIRDGAGWSRSLEPDAMLVSLREKGSKRKLRLFGVACCRQIWKELVEERSRSAVESAEQFADMNDRVELAQAREEAIRAFGEVRGDHDIPRTVSNIDALQNAFLVSAAANAAEQIAAEDAYQAASAVAGTMAYLYPMREATETLIWMAARFVTSSAIRSSL